MALHAILTAGGTLPASLRKFSASPVKALLPVGGRTLLDTAVAAVRDCGLVERIAAVGGPDVEQALPAGAEYVPQGLDVVDNVHNGFIALGGIGHDYLVLSPDLPFATADGLAAFLAAAHVKAEMAFPVVAGADFLARFPGAPNRFEKLDGARVTLGSCIFMTGRMLQMNIPLGRDFYRYRKLPHKLAMLLGWDVVWGYLTGRLKLAVLEARVSRLMDGRVCGITGADAGLAYDIDNCVNYNYALAQLAAAP